MSSNDSDQSPLLASNVSVKNEDSDNYTNDVDNTNDNDEGSPVTPSSRDAAEDGDGSSWGWVVVAASFYCVGVVGGVCNMTGVLLDSLQRDLSGDVAAISLTGSVLVAVWALLGVPLARKLISLHGGRRVCMAGATVATLGLLAASFVPSLPLLILCYSVITGLGFGLIYLPAVVACVPYFTRRRSLATGLVFCGSGVGIFTLAPLTSTILHSLGWRWVMRTFSALSGVGILAGATMVPVTTEQQQTRDANPSPSSSGSDDNISPPRIWRKLLTLVLGEDLATHNRVGTYSLFVLTNFLRFIAVYITFTYVPTFAESQGVSAPNAAFLISVGGICNTVGRFVGGAISDLSWVQPLHLTCLTLAASLIPAFVIPFSRYYWTFLIAVGMDGFLTGMVVGCSSPVLVDMVGPENISAAFSGILAFCGLSSLIGPPLAGMMVDTWNNPQLPLVMAAVAMVASAVLAGLTDVADMRHRRRQEYTRIE